MFGLLRFFLALIVLWHHLGDNPGSPAYLSVWGFYMLSGFLMCLIMNEKYGFDTTGKIKYLKDRAFRIFPAYWLSIILSILLISFIPIDFINAYHVALKIPADILTWFKNIFIFGLRPGISTRLTPPAWALNIELIYYILIGFITSRSFKLTAIATGVFFVVCCYALFKSQSPYSNILCSGLPFMLGGCLYFGLRKIKYRNNNYVIANAIILLALILSFILIEFFDAIQFSIWLLIFQVVFAMFVAILFFTASEKFKRTDKILGDMSYYIYLLHWQIGLIITYCFGLSKGDYLVWVAMPVVILLSVALVLTFDPVILKIKKRLS
ncbi:acyltransferase family protein [Cytophaga aurantiaca]|uniref:acyltransferase family protein n=1 Tax=Cytophaga aurantiaca TaxID=29530 RepID=UPI0003A6D267|nr:acyltransferase [Cytophaga aurantiaca]